MKIGLQLSRFFSVKPLFYILIIENIVNALYIAKIYVIINKWLKVKYGNKNMNFVISILHRSVIE